MHQKAELRASVGETEFGLYDRPDKWALLFRNSVIARHLCLVMLALAPSACYRAPHSGRAYGIQPTGIPDVVAYGERVVDSRGTSVEDGPWTSWRDGRELVAVGRWSNGVVDGIWIMIDEHGFIDKIEMYDKGLKHGPWVDFDPGYRVRTLGQYANDLKEGTWVDLGEGNGVNQGVPTGEIYRNGVYLRDATNKEIADRVVSRAGMY